MTDDSVERQLRQLGDEWPADESFVDGVMSRVDSEPQRSNVPDHSRGRLMRFSYWAAGTIVVCFGLWWAVFPQGNEGVFYAQVKEAFKQVQTIHNVVSVKSDDGNMRQVAETWFARGKGFAVIRPDQIRIDNGTYFWEHEQGSDTASRTKSLGTDELLDQALNFREELERDCERFQAGDRRIDGVDHECYRLTFHGAARPADPSFLDFDNRRTLIFIDPKSLPRRVESHEKADDEWQTRVVRTWEYDVPVDLRLFEPQFDKHVQVIDTDAAFDQLLAVENSVHSEQRAGLIYVDV